MQGNLFQTWPDYVGPLTNHPLYAVHNMMFQRCYSDNNADFSNYGGRGIVVDPRFLSRRSFIGWALQNGYRPGLQLDRIDNDGDYSPDNCCFSTHSENQRNKRNNVRTVAGGLAVELAEGWNIPENLWRARYRRGYPSELAATLPPGVYMDHIERLADDGQFQTILGLLVGPYLKETK